MAGRTSQRGSAIDGLQAEEEAYATAHTEQLDKEGRVRYLRREAWRRMAAEQIATAVTGEEEMAMGSHKERQTVVQPARLSGLDYKDEEGLYDIREGGEDKMDKGP